MEEILTKLLEFADKQTDWKENNDTTNSQVVHEFINRNQKLVNNCIIPDVSNRFSPEQMAEWFHNNYEEIAKAEGWQTQDKCKVEFKDLPESNRITMIKVCERWLNDW